MLQDLGLEVFIAGIETSNQLNMLTNLNLDYAQGFFISKPLALQDMNLFLKSNYETDHKTKNEFAQIRGLESAQVAAF